MAAYSSNFVTTSITRVGTTATATYTAHGLVNGAQVVITGAFPTLYNGTYTISGVAANTFNYTMASDPGGSATVQGFVNVTDIDAFGIAATNDTLSISNNGLIVAQTNQNRRWSGISVIQGRLWVKNTSTTVGNRFCMGRETSTGHCILACGSQLGTIQIDGAWISLGAGTGAQQDVTSPFPQVGSGFDYIPVLWVETAPGSGEYEAWFNCTMSYGEAVWKYLREDLAALIPNAKKGKFFRQIPLDETTINPATTPGNCHFTSTLRFGEAGNMVPSGCNIRCHNIYITRSDLTNHIDSGGNLSGFGQGSGNYLLSNCIIGDMTWLTTNCSVLSGTDVDFCIPPAWGTVYEANLTRCAIHSGHANLWYDTSTTPAQWKVRDRRHATFAPTALPGLTMDGCYWLDRFNLNNSPGATLTNCENNSTIRSTLAQIGLAISSSTKSTVTDLRLRNSALNIAAGSEITVDGWDVDMGMFNESTGFQSAVGSQGTNTPRFGALPNGTRFVNGTPYYFKIRNYYSWWDVGNASFYMDSPITYSATPYSGRLDAADNSDAHPYYFGAALSVIANAWTVQFAWNNVSALLPFTKYQIFKSTTWGSLGSQLGADISTASTVATTDATLTNNTTYYYTLRYFRNATDYTDSAQQVVIVPNYTPTAANYLSSVTNLCLQSATHATVAWSQHSANNCVVANNGRQWLRDANPAAPSLYTCSKVTFHATLVSGLKQTIAVTNGQTYAIMIRLAGDNVSADAVNVILSATTGTTDTMNCLVKRSATEYVLYHTASSTSLVLAYYSDASSYGKVIYLDASLTLGNYRSPYINTTTAAVTASAYIELASAGSCRIQAMSKGGRKLIEIGYNLIPANVLFNETYCDTDPNFTPSKENMICTTVATQNTGVLNPSGVSDDVVVKNVTARCRVATETTGGAISGPVYVSSGLQTNWVLSNWSVDLGWMSERATVAGQTAAFWSDFIISDWTISNAKGYYSYLGSSQVACNKTTYANVVADAADLYEVLTPSSGQQIKGCSSGWVGARTDAVNSLLFGQIGGIQSPTVQFDSIFNELFLESATEGLMHVNFVPSVLAAKPYAISGSGMVFDNNNSLYTTQAEDSIIYRWPWRLKGITGWQNKRYVVNSVNLGYNASTAFGVLVEYRLSTDGITYGAWKEMIWANTSSEDLNDAYMDLRLTVKQHFRFITKVSDFVVGETIQNATSSPTATAIVRSIETDPTTATAGTIWVDTITGTWQYTDPIWIAGTRRATMQGDVTYGAAYPNIASRITGLAWYTTTDRTKKYPTSYCNIALSSLTAGSLVSAFDGTTGSWLEATSSGAGSTADLAVPWYADGNITLKILKSGYQDDTRTIPMTRFGTTLVGAQQAWTRIAAGDPGSIALTFTDHGTSPVTREGKLFRYTLVVTDGSTASKIAQWLYFVRANGGTISGVRADALPPLIVEDSGTAYETRIGAITTVATAAGGLWIEDGSGDPIAGFTRMQSNDGSYWSPPVTDDLVVTSNESGTLLQVFATGTQTIITSTTGTSLSYTHSGQTVDIVAQKAGFLPQRVTGVVLAGDVTQAFTLAVDYNYDASHGLTYTSDASWSRSNNKLTVPTWGPSIRGVYSLMIDSYISESSLLNTPFNLSMNGPTSLFLIDNAEGATDSSITNMVGGGVRYISTAGNTTAEFVGVLSSGVVAGSQPEYELGSSGIIADTIATGDVNEIIKTYGNSTHGNFDKRTHFQFKVQRNGYRQAEYDIISGYGLTAVEPTLYIISLVMPAIDGLVLGDPGISGVTVTAVSGSAISWDAGDGAKDYSITIEDSNNNSGTDILRYLNYNLSLDATFEGKEPFYWPEMVFDNGAKFESLRGILHNNPDHIAGVRVIRTGGDPHPDFTRFQSDDGTYGTPAIYLPATVSGQVSGSSVLIYNVTKDNTLFAGSLTGTWSQPYTEGTDASVNDLIEVYVSKYNGTTAKLPAKFTTTVGAGGWSIGITQEDATTYNTYGTDGANVTDVIFDLGSIDFDFNSIDGLVTWAELYAAYIYQQSLVANIKTFYNRMTAIDAVNFAINDAIVFKNIGTNPVKVGGDGYCVRADGGSLFGSTNLDIENVGKAYAISVGGISPSEAQIKSWVRAELATEMARIDVANSSIKNNTDSIPSIQNMTSLIPGALK